MGHLELINNISVALALAFAGGYLARLARIPTIVGYLAAGVILSPFTPGFDADLETIRQLAEVGVIFLMFGIGLHFNIADLLSVRGIAIPGALLLMTSITALGVAIAWSTGLGTKEGIVIGLAASIASSVVISRALEDRGLVQSIPGRIVVGWTIVEDLLTVIILAALPILANNGQENVGRQIAEAVIKSGAFLLVMLTLGPLVIPWLLRRVAMLGSRELFILGVVALALGIASGGTQFGVSVALGAFIAGVVVSETEMGHQATADVLPLREAFAVLFFVSVGMLMDPGELLDRIDILSLVLALVIAGKAFIILVIFAFLPYPARTALIVAAGSSQMGEFSFLIADQSLQLELVSDSTYNIILAASIISIALNPLAWKLAHEGEGWLRGSGPLWRVLNRSGPLPPPPAEADGHVVILGYGRVGELTGHVLRQLEIPHLVVDADLSHARRLANAGQNVVWGDAASHDVLEQTGLERARLLVCALPDENTTFLAITNARRINPTVPVVVRARERQELLALRELGVQEVVVPEYEGGLELMRQTLLGLGYDGEEALRYSRAVRDIHYEPGAPEPNHV